MGLPALTAPLLLLALMLSVGLGKTLQSITTLYTLLRNGRHGPDKALGGEGVPIVKRAIVVCPCSLVNNWAQV